MSYKQNYMLYKTIMCCLISKKIICRIRKIICCFIFKQHIYVGVTCIYLTLFSSNKCMLVIYVFMLHNKHIYVIVVPHICCSKHPTPCTCFFLWCTVRLDPCHHSGTVSKFTVSQWDHTSLKVGYHDHV